MTSARPRSRWPLAIPAALTVALAALHIPYPVEGDQALFLLGARALSEGGTLYVDFWDNKQPGIFWFYALGGEVFGFDAEGVHSLEALWLLATAVLLTLAVRGDLRQRWVAALTPATTVGLFYWNARGLFLTQVESLVALPLAACLWIGIAAARRPERAPALMCAFGVSAAVVATFKLVLVPIACVIWLTWLVSTRGAGQRWSPAALGRLLLPAVAGGTVTLAAVIGYFAARGAFDEFVFANFEYPMAALAQVPAKGARRLLTSAGWLIRVAVPLAPLAVFALVDLRRERLRLVERLAFAWLAASLVAIGVQRFSYWTYHFTLALFPIGVLAISALDRLASALLERGVARRWAAGAVCAFVALLWFAAPREGLASLRALHASGVLRGTFSAPALRESLDPRDGAIARSVEFLASSDASPGPIYVFGTPKLLLASGRRGAIPTHGWGWEMFLDSQWQALPQQLEAAAPAYIYVNRFYAKQIERRSPETRRLLAGRYDVLSADRAGTWYRLRRELGRHE